MKRPEETTDLVRLGIESDGTLQFSANLLLWAVLVGIALLIIMIRWLMSRKALSRSYEIDSAELGLGDSKLIFKPNLNDRSVAYKIWVELSTRKIGLPIDYDHDVITEVYDSWYTFFSVTRELIKDIPVQKVRHDSTRKIVLLSIDVLNLGLRPHLTRWQARFRRWFEFRLSMDPEAKLHPQDIQREFPDYNELIADMRQVNNHLITYRDRMNELVHL